MKGKEMDVIERLSEFEHVIQFAFMVGCFAAVLLVAYNRTAAKNLLLFLRSLHEIWSQHHITIKIVQTHPLLLDIVGNVRLMVCSEEDKEGRREEQVMAKTEL
jgi:hypothetical protein